MRRHRASRPPRSAQEAEPNDTKSDAKPRREALGRSRGGLTTKIHLAADIRCRPLSRVTTAGHRHDCLAFEAVMAGIRICRTARSGPPSPSRPASKPTVCIEHARADGHQNLIPRSTSNATLSSAASTSSRATVRWQADMTNGTTCIAEPSTSHQSGSGSAIPFHDPRDRL